MYSKYKIKPIILALISLLLFFNTNFYAQSILHNDFNFISARAASMGNAFTSVVDDATAMIWNSAAMSRIDDVQLSVMGYYGKNNYSFTGVSDQVISGINTQTKPIGNINYTGFVSPYSEGIDNTHIGFSIQYIEPFNHDYLQSVETANGQDSQWRQDYNGGIFKVTTAISFDVSKKLSLGLAANFYSGSMVLNYKNSGASTFQIREDEQNDWDYSGVSFNLGSLYSLNNSLTLGLNLGFPYVITKSHGSNELEIGFPFFINISASYEILESLLVAVEYAVKPWSLMTTEYLDGTGKPWKNDLNSFHFGIERRFNWKKLMLPIRMGYRTEPTFNVSNSGSQISKNVYSLGFGLHLQDIGINFSGEWMPSSLKVKRYNLNSTYFINDISIKENSYRFSFDLFVNLNLF